MIGEYKATSNLFDQARVLSWSMQLLDGLNYLHQNKPNPIVHRDLKPE